MEKAKISAYQLFTLLLLFELGSALVYTLANGAKQDAWMAVLMAMVGGFCLFFIHYRLYCYYPNLPPMEYMQMLLGPVLGKIIAFLFILYFMYVAATILRGFGEMLVISAYPATPIFFINALFILVIIYTVYKGIEVLSRTSEVLFFVVSLLAVSIFLLIILSGNINMDNLKPVFEEGVSPIIKTVFTDTLYFPFGQMIIFTMILPYVNERKKVKRTGLLAIGMSGFVLALITAMNISVLGIDRTTRSPFPFLTTIQMIELAGFLERLDVYFILLVTLTAFVKLSVFFYVTVLSVSHLFHVKHPSHLAYPLGMVVLFLSMAVASNWTEYNQEWFKVEYVYIDPLFQVILPIFLLIVAFFKNRKKAV
ncbi:GerAB/ArcD/ProY family transporter [Domibacillus mangrovi]|uniref:Spore gernimation protein KB n=1 Tax=Domibacillus mangrovi TaxID=1714354 RepID=A0A1Q5P091_9BACI|nr:GerAB/ArcD/ProY family transporter [Domibacillus mangrovi]OKL35679.1 spore gernimation protein KB [Domibacillus mangrovi]